MGTRGLLGFRKKGAYKGAYNHFDSYPDGLGVTIVKFILSLSSSDRQRMIEHISELTWVDQASKPDDAAIVRYVGLQYANLSVGDRTPDDWYCLLHKMQNGACLKEILEGNLKHLSDDTSFLEDGLFCEWAYFVDFEEGELETWSSGQKVDVVKFEDLKDDYMTNALVKKMEEGSE